MSIYVMAPVLRAHFPDVAASSDRDRGGRGSTGTTLKLIALGLADSANEDGTGASPGVRVLADFAQCHTATVVRGLAALVELGAIHLTQPGGPGRCATYTVDVEWMTAGMSPRGRRTCPLRDPGAQGERATPGAQGRAPLGRARRAPLGRALTFPTSIRPSDDVTPEPVLGDFECIHPGCSERVPGDAQPPRARCEEHTVIGSPRWGRRR